MAAKEVDTEGVDYEREQKVGTERNVEVKAAIKLLQAILDNPDKYLKLKILVCGQTGVGKSSLVNSLVGYKVCPVGDPGDIERSVDPGLHKGPSKAFMAETSIVKKVEANINGTIITIWDSPGLQDGTVNEEQYLQDMYDNCSDVDLVLYCVAMTTVRWTNQERNAVTLITQKFGESFWDKCILVLTKANMVRIPKENKKNKRVYLERLYTNFIHQLRQQLSEQEVPERVYSKLPAVAAGMVEGDIDEKDEETFNERYLMYVSERREDKGTREDFIAELWVTVFEVLKRDEYAQAKLVNITDPSRMTITGDAKTSNAQTVKQILQHREKMSQIRVLSSAQVEDDVQQSKQCKISTTDPSHTTKSEDEKKSDPCTTKETLEHPQTLVSAQVKHDAQQPKQNEKLKQGQQLLSSRTTAMKDDEKSDPSTKETLQHAETLASVQVEHDDEQAKQNENATKDVTEKLEKVQKFYEGIPKPEKMEGADNMVIDGEHINRIADVACVSVFSGMMAGGATYGAYYGGISGTIGGPVGVALGGALGAVVGATAGLVTAGVVKIVSMISRWFLKK